MNKALLILNGKNFNKKKFLEITQSEKIFSIAVDGGINHIPNYKKNIDLHIGDMDSTKKDILLPLHIKKTLTFPKNKDFSDYHLALNFAFEKGYKHIDVFGYNGGRTDHFISIYESSVFFANKGINITLIGNDEKIYFKNKNFILNVPIGSTISIYSGTQKIKNLTLSGLQYLVKEYTLLRNFPIGLSNVATKKKIKITFTSGVIVLFLNS
jgi:thiamine pyrophosphokinase